ncbi:TonB-dependent receptor [Tunturiibacter lichenicola]|uniref:TonB-dependent receptor n=1 Tax=Tunturiibacter lichenicola TaxID=2051959 RepID=UPI003D9ACD63
MLTLAARRATRSLLALAAAILLFTLPAKAVSVHGTVTTPLGIPLGNARVQLIQGRKVASFTFTLQDGSYEIRSAVPGRFVLLISAAPFTPSIGKPFYGGVTDIIARDIVMEYSTITPQLGTTATGIPTPLPQIPSAITLIPEGDLYTQVGILNDLRQSPGNVAVQTGQAGGPIALYVRGGGPTTNQVLIDGIPAADIGGLFDYSSISTTALTGPELYRGANSALYGTGTEASVVNLATTRSSLLAPVVNYTGDAGNFHTYRNEAILSGAINKFDYQAAFSRFNTSNALPLDEYHTTNSIANIGYSILSNTLARFTLRNIDSAVGLPDAHDIYGISASGKRADQDLYSGITVENILAGNWRNLVRYGIARKREQVEQFTPTGEPVTTISDGLPTTTYYGDTVTLRGANGYTATGQAAFITPSFDAVSNRDELLYQTNYTFPHRIAALFSFHYENERGRLLDTATSDSQTAQRTNFLYTLQVQGDVKHRLFYFAGGSIEQNHLYGIAGTPRIGLAYAPVRPGKRWFRGTNLRANVATGVQEPSVADQFTSLYDRLQQTGNQSAIATYNITPITFERSRTYDFGVDQNILNQKVILKAGYFHNQFNRQLESIGANGLEHYFGIPANIADEIPPATLNSLAYRTQGMELEVQYRPVNHLFLDGGYTYLASLVLQSFSSDAVAAANGTPTTNPNIPGIAIGALSPLVGSRPFRRPPSSGFFAVEYVTNKFSTAIKGALASRSDDSTFQLNNDRNGGNTLLLPNRNLDFGYAKLDFNMLFDATRRVTVFTQLDNLLGQQHIGPIGYPGLPFTIRAGAKIRIGGN